MSRAAGAGDRISDAFVTVAGEAIQLLGGIGFTAEHDAHLYFKRAWTTPLAARQPRRCAGWPSREQADETSG